MDQSKKGKPTVVKCHDLRREQGGRSFWRRLSCFRRGPAVAPLENEERKDNEDEAK
jgi:hypothetical protein